MRELCFLENNKPLQVACCSVSWPWRAFFDPMLPQSEHCQVTTLSANAAVSKERVLCRKLAALVVSQCLQMRPPINWGHSHAALHFAKQEHIHKAVHRHYGTTWHWFLLVMFYVGKRMKKWQGRWYFKWFSTLWSKWSNYDGLLTTIAVHHFPYLGILYILCGKIR